MLIFLEQVTGGSLEESREALAISETDGLFVFFRSFSQKVSVFEKFLIANVYIFAGRLFCTVGVHPTRCNVSFFSYLNVSFL